MPIMIALAKVKLASSTGLWQNEEQPWD